MSKGKTFTSSIGQIIKGLFKLLMLFVYGCAKLIQTLSGFIAKISEKLIN